VPERENRHWPEAWFCFRRDGNTGDADAAVTEFNGQTVDGRQMLSILRARERARVAVTSAKLELKPIRTLE